VTTVDAHQHFIDPRARTYPWMTPELAPIDRPFGPADLAPELAAAGIAWSIVVQTVSSTAETEAFLAIAEASPFVAGVVGWVDLTAPDVGDTIARLRAGPGGDRLVAIRHQVHDESDPGWLSRPDVRRGLAAVEAAGLAYDLLVRPRELPAALDLAVARPGFRLVIDHLAKPPIRTGQLEPWSSRIRPFGRLPNTWCKLSGLVTEADWGSWEVRDLVPYVAIAVETFGASRLVFGSDWPVCLLAGSYAEVVAAARALAAGLSDDERAAVFGGAAVEAYRLSIAPDGIG
jgi:L-fucono-1,5-lactonase